MLIFEGKIGQYSLRHLGKTIPPRLRSKSRRINLAELTLDILIEGSFNIASHVNKATWPCLQRQNRNKNGAAIRVIQLGLMVRNYLYTKKPFFADKRVKNCCSLSKSQYVCFTLLRSLNTAFPALLSCVLALVATKE